MDTTNAPQIIEHAQKSLTFTPFDVKWVPSSARLVLLGETPSAKGAFQIYQLDQKTEGRLKLLADVTKTRGYKCGSFGASTLSERAIAVGDFSGKLTIIDLETRQEMYSVQAHTGILNSIDGAGGGESAGAYGPPELLTGGRDGIVRVWDPRQQDPVVSLEPAEQAPDCWAVAFGNSYNASERMLAAGYDNGDVKLFDLRTNYLQWDSNLLNGVCGVQFDRKDTQMNKLAAATLEGRIHVFDLRTFNASQGGYARVSEAAHKSTVWGVQHCPSNRDLFVTQGGNGQLNLYQYNYPSQRSVSDENSQPMGVPGTLTLLNQREVSTQPINSFDWSRDREGLAAVTCLDQTLRVFFVTKLNLY